MITMSSLDGIFALADYYEMNSGGDILALKGSSSPFSVEEVKNCPACRGPLRNLNRYSRMVRRSAIDEATKKFISWSNLEVIEHANMLRAIQEQFQSESEAAPSPAIGHGRDENKAEREDRSDIMKVSGHRNEVMAEIEKIDCLSRRYRTPFQARRRLTGFLQKVREDEQPFGRVWALVQDHRRRQMSSCQEDDIAYTPSVVQSRTYLMSMSLSIKFDITVIADALAIRKKATGLTMRYGWAAVELEVDFSELREECLALAELLASHKQHRLEIETRLSFAHLAALERSTLVGARTMDRSNSLRVQGSAQVSLARHIQQEFPSQTTGVMEELEAVESMLTDGTFYRVVTSEEKRAVYAAMSEHFSGTGHWYTCENGHPFTIGECGMPIERARCPECNSPIGGQQHRAEDGVRHLDEVEAALGNMDLAGD